MSEHFIYNKKFYKNSLISDLNIHEKQKKFLRDAEIVSLESLVLNYDDLLLIKGIGPEGERKIKKSINETLKENLIDSQTAQNLSINNNLNQRIQKEEILRDSERTTKERIQKGEILRDSERTTKDPIDLVEDFDFFARRSENSVDRAVLVEAFSVLLILRWLKPHSQLQKVLGGDFMLKWRNLTAHKQRSQIVEEHINSAADMFLESPDGFWGLDGKVMGEALKRMSLLPVDVLLLMLDKVSNIHPGRIGGLEQGQIVLDQILKWVVKDDGEAANLYSTDENIASEMVRMADPKPGEEVYDPCFGIGGILTRAMGHGYRSADERRADWASGKEIHGREVDPSRYIVGFARIIYSGASDPVLQSGDSLRYGNSPESRGPQYDCIIANPPSIISSKAQFADSRLDVWRHRAFTHPFAESDCLLFLQHVLGSLRPGGRAVILLPSSFLNMPEKNMVGFRRELVHNYNIRKVKLIHYNLCLLEIHNIAPDNFITLINQWETSRQAKENLWQSRLDDDGHNKRLLSLPVEDTAVPQEVNIEGLASTGWNLFPKSVQTVALESYWSLPQVKDSTIYSSERMVLLRQNFALIPGVRLEKGDLGHKHGPNEGNIFVLRADDLFGLSSTGAQNRLCSGHILIKKLYYTLTRSGEERLRGQYSQLDAKLLREGDILFSVTRGVGCGLMVPELPHEIKCIVAGSGVSVLRRRRRADISSADLHTIMNDREFRLWAISMKNHPFRGHLIQELKRLKVPVRKKDDDNEEGSRFIRATHEAEDTIEQARMAAPGSELSDDSKESIKDSAFLQWVLNIEYSERIAALAGNNSTIALFGVAHRINSVTKAESNLTDPILIGLEQLIFSKWIDKLRDLAARILSLEGKDYSDDYYQSVTDAQSIAEGLNLNSDGPFGYGIIPSDYRSYINRDDFEELNDSAKRLGWRISEALGSEIRNHYEEQSVSVSHQDGIVFLDDETIEFRVSNQGPLSLNRLVIGDSFVSGLGCGDSCTFELSFDKKIRSIVNEKSAYTVVELPLRILWVSQSDGYEGVIERTIVFEVGVSRKDEYPDIGEYPEDGNDADRSHWSQEQMQRLMSYPYSAEAMNMTDHDKKMYQLDDVEPWGMTNMEKRFEKRGAWLESLSGQAEEKQLSDLTVPGTKEHDFGANPYVAGPAIQNKEKLFGRGKIVGDIKDILPEDSDANVILLEGNRRSGKTSILNYLKDPEVLSGWIACYSSLQDAEGSARGAGLDTCEVFRSLAQDIGVVLLKRDIEFRDHGYQSSDFDPEDKGKINGWKAHTREIFKTDYPKGIFEECLESFMEAAAPGRILLMLDEFDKLQEGIDAGVTSSQVPENLRALIQNFPAFNAILSGSRRIKRLRDEYWSALFGLGHRIGVTAIDEKDARDLITIPSDGKLIYSENSIIEILRVTACQPFLIQSLCKDIFLEAKYQKNHRISVDFTKEIIVEKAVENEHFSSLWEYAETKRRRLILYLALKCQQEKSYLTINEIEKGLNQYGVIYEPGEKLEDDIAFLLEMEMLKFVNQQSQQYYVFEVPFFAMWIENNKNEDLLLRELEAE